MDQMKPSLFLFFLSDFWSQYVPHLYLTCNVKTFHETIQLPSHGHFRLLSTDKVLYRMRMREDDVIR